MGDGQDGVEPHLWAESRRECLRANRELRSCSDCLARSCSSGRALPRNSNPEPPPGNDVRVGRKNRRCSYKATWDRENTERRGGWYLEQGEVARVAAVQVHAVHIQHQVRLVLVHRLLCLHRQVAGHVTKPHLGKVRHTDEVLLCATSAWDENPPEHSSLEHPPRKPPSNRVHKGEGIVSSGTWNQKADCILEQELSSMIHFAHRRGPG